MTKWGCAHQMRLSSWWWRYNLNYIIRLGDSMDSLNRKVGFRPAFVGGKQTRYIYIGWHISKRKQLMNDQPLNIYYLKIIEIVCNWLMVQIFKVHPDLHWPNILVTNFCEFHWQNMVAKVWQINREFHEFLRLLHLNK